MESRTASVKYDGRSSSACLASKDSFESELELLDDTGTLLGLDTETLLGGNTGTLLGRDTGTLAFKLKL